MYTVLGIVNHLEGRLMEDMRRCYLNTLHQFSIMGLENPSTLVSMGKDLENMRGGGEYNTRTKEPTGSEKTIAELSVAMNNASNNFSEPSTGEMLPTSYSVLPGAVKFASGTKSVSRAHPFVAVFFGTLG